MNRKFISAALLTLLAGAAQADPLDVFGTYSLPDGDSRVRLSDCGDATPCGHVVWLNANSLEPGETPETVKDAAGTPVLGLKLLHSFKRSKQDWRGGKIYDPRNGQTYQSRLKKRADGTLEVKGCVGPICQTQIWAPTK